MKLLLCLFVAIITAEVAAFADIAPTKIVGSGIVPINAAGIRMTSAKVNIEWGAPCNMSAVFELDNETSKPISVQLGFPIKEPRHFGKEIPPDLGISFAFDGVPVESSNISKIDGLKDKDLGDYFTWYECQHVFSPGKTIVTVNSKLLASLTYREKYRENLYYCIQTGGRWQGTIGSEEVNIKFPNPVTRDDIFEIAPQNFTIKGNVVQWQFNDVKPKDNEYDIHIEYLHPEVAARLSEIRAAFAKNPRSPALVLDLAKHLFELGSTRGSGFPPYGLKKEEFAAFLDKIGRKSELDREIFEAGHTFNNNNDRFEIGGPGWDNNAKAITRILSDLDYQDPYVKSTHVDEAKAMVERVLKQQPHNSEAWNLYLVNYWRFKFGAVGVIFQPMGFFEKLPSGFFKDQINAITEAHRDCPDDSCIDLWYQWCTGPHKDDESNAALENELRKRGLSVTDYPVIKYDYY